MTVSIIIPTYNQGKYLEECVNSAKNQTFTDTEIIIVDDGSTDNTLDIETKFDNILLLIKNNGGTASALNMGIQRSKGEWIHWLSSDDVLLPDAIENMMKYVNKTNRIYYTDYLIINEGGEIIKEFREPLGRNEKTREENYEELKKYYYGNGSTSMIHKSVFDKIGYFDESLPYFEDYDFWLKAVKNGIKLWHLPIITLKYRNHPEQLTNRADLSKINEVRKRYG